jgi:methyltransferase (TIGR00027 family)
MEGQAAMGVDGQPVRAASRTAIAAAIIRATHFKYGGEPRILEDAIAERLLGADMPAAAASGDMNSRAGVLLRSRFAEDRIARAVERGVCQLVVLGAGLDSFAYRQPSWAESLSIFEIDQPSSLSDKRRRLAEGAIDIPANVTHVPIDFERTSLRDGCRAAGIEFDKPTFFSCLGVLGYLNRQAVDEIFRLVSEFPAGSEIAFTYFGEPFPPSVLEFISKTDEPLLTVLNPDELAADLRKLGFIEITTLAPEEANRRYFGVRRDGLKAPRSPMIAAAVKGRVPRPSSRRVPHG